MDNQPTRNIMRTGEWSDADCYRVACDCHDRDHDLDVWIEVESDREVQDVTVTLYKELYSPVWEPGFNRFCEAIRLLFTGTTRVAGSIIMRRAVAENFLATVRQSIDRLDQTK
jgi:hypothetical protein